MIKKNRGYLPDLLDERQGDAETSAYNASKFGLQGFAQALMYEMRKNNIRVMVLNPSSVETIRTPGRNTARDCTCTRPTWPA